ncbi:MAG: hypothetical protein DRH32_06965 [Deltaproteobacteria bacterium]|nr:MAG: hypothetical protein DRH32_06965 [Deltaproteobacteria bacterium]
MGLVRYLSGAGDKHLSYALKIFFQIFKEIEMGHGWNGTIGDSGRVGHGSLLVFHGWFQSIPGDTIGLICVKNLRYI